jgi:Flp pilus assembly protein TadG
MTTASVDGSTRRFWSDGLFRRFASDRDGVTALEFAILAPVLLLLLFGTIETARFLFVQNTVEAATAAALRQAIIDPTLGTTALRERFVANLAGLDPTLLETFSLDRAAEPGTTLQRVTVSAGFTFQPIVELVFEEGWRIETIARGATSS